MKSEFLATTVAQPTEVYEESLPDATRSSSYNRLVRASAWVLRFVKNVCAKKNGKPLVLDRQLSVTEFRAAEQLWWKCVQQEAFSDDIARLRAGQAVSSSSRLRQLSPELDGHGVIRLEGRLDKAVGCSCFCKASSCLAS